MRFTPCATLCLCWLCASPMLAAAGTPHPACAPSPEVVAILGQFYEGGGDERAPALREAIARYPHDVHLQRAYQDNSGGEDLLERYRAEAAAHADDPMALYLYGRVLQQQAEDPAAEQQFLAALEIDPRYPWAHFGLARFYESLRKDPAKAQQHLAAAIDACPNSPVILRRFGDLPRSEVAPRAAAARTALAQSAGPEIAILLQAVWAAEFKTSPPAEYDALRERVRGDLALLREPRLAEDRRVLGAMLEGYRLVEDDAGFDRTLEELARRYPEDETARRTAFERFAASHASPEDCIDDAYGRALADAARRWSELWPRDPRLRLMRVQGLALSSSPSLDELAAAVDALREAAAARPSAVPATPLTFECAQALMMKRLLVERVPALVEQGMAEIRARAAGGAPQGDPQRSATGLALLVGARLQLGETEAARASFAELQQVLPLEREGKRQLTTEQESRLRRGRAIDEVLRASFPCGPPTEPDADQRLVESLDPELGRAFAESRASMPQRPPVDESFGEPVSIALPEFELQDLSGRTWRPADLRGKVVLLHAWGLSPAVVNAMLPWLEELGLRLAARQDVVLLAVSADDNPGEVASFVKGRGFTVPVVCSKDLIQKLNDGQVSLPNTWIVDRQGVARREASGFGFDKEGWLARAQRAIEEIGAEKP